MGIKIRNAKPQDSFEINKVYYDSWLNTYPNKDFNISKKDIETYLKDSLSEEKIESHQAFLKKLPEGAIVLVAEKNGVIVGFLFLQNGNKKKDVNNLRAIYIKPKYQKLGIGRKLWENALVFLDKTKDTNVRVVGYNKEAIGFYKKLGFVFTGNKFSNEIEIKEGFFITEIEMSIKNYEKTPML